MNHIDISMVIAHGRSATHACVPKRLLAAGRHFSVQARTMEIPRNPPFPKGDDYSSLWPPAQEGLWPGGQREVGRDLEVYFLGNTSGAHEKAS
jgi:hypothetical protein